MTSIEEQQNIYNNEEQDGSPLKSSIILERQQGPFPSTLYSPNRPQMINNVTVTNSIAAYRPSFAAPISNYTSVQSNTGTMPAYLTSPTRTTLPTYIPSPYRRPLVSNGYGEDAYVKPVNQHIAATPYGLYSPGRRATSFAPVYAQPQPQPAVKYETSSNNYTSYNMHGAPVSPMYSPLTPNVFNPIPSRPPSNQNYSIRPQQAPSQYSPVTQRRDSNYLGATGPVTYGRSSVAPSYGHGSLNYGANTYGSQLGANTYGSQLGANTYGSQLGASTAYGSIRMTCTDQVGRLGKKPKRKYVH